MVLRKLKPKGANKFGTPWRQHVLLSSLSTFLLILRRSNLNLNGSGGGDSFLMACSFTRLSSFTGASCVLISVSFVTGFDSTGSPLFCKATILVIFLSPSCDTMRWG